MLARHHGHVVLVWARIPGERVPRESSAGKGVIYADTTEVLGAHRRIAATDGRLALRRKRARLRRLTGGSCWKGQIIQDAMARIGRVPAAPPPEVGHLNMATGCARVCTLQTARWGFTAGERTCCAAPRQTPNWRTPRMDRRARECSSPDSLAPGGHRALGEHQRRLARWHLELHGGVDGQRSDNAGRRGASGLSAARGDRRGRRGSRAVRQSRRSSASRAPQRDVRAFFQGNRFLLEPLVQHVGALVGTGPVIDLYAGVGLFGLSLAAAMRPASSSWKAIR